MKLNLMHAYLFVLLTQGAASSPVPTEPPAPAPAETSEEFGKGVVFYMKGKRVVGVVLWNVFNRMPIARKVSSCSLLTKRETKN